jgi:phosphoenolpyruvate carboxykinase (ATP)
VLDLSYLGFTDVAAVFHNPSTPRLYTEAIRRGEAEVGHLGPLVVSTGEHTGWSADNRFIVSEPSTEDRIWWGTINRPCEPGDFQTVLAGLRDHVSNRELFVQDCYVGADPDFRVKVRVITELAWHSLFARNVFIQEHDRGVLAEFAPDYTVVLCPDFRPDGPGDTGPFFIVSFDRRLILIGGTGYAGEMKQALFTVMNYLLPDRGVLSLHSAAGIGPKDETALLVGPSGSGKTTLGTDPELAFIADDALGWSDDGVFNLEGGCHARVVRLSAEAEPEIYQTTRRFGTVLENVGFVPGTQRVDYQGGNEDTRSVYPLTHLANIAEGSTGGHPRQIILLTVDATGVLPPIARLTPEQAVYYFLSGYSSSPAGVGTEPSAVFSPCFAAPFLPLHPAVYADLFAKKIAEHHVTVWLVNTGWTGDPGNEGRRLTVPESRAVIRAAVSYHLAGSSRDFIRDPIFRFCVPRKCRGFPTELLVPRYRWTDPDKYDAAADEIARRFAENFEQFAGHVAPEVAEAGPILA